MLWAGGLRFKPFPFGVVIDGALKGHTRTVQSEVHASVVVMSDFVHPLADTYAGLPGWVLLSRCSEPPLDFHLQVQKATRLVLKGAPEDRLTRGAFASRKS